jgi:hypothetical protein
VREVLGMDSRADAEEPAVEAAGEGDTIDPVPESTEAPA